MSEEDTKSEAAKSEVAAAKDARTSNVKRAITNKRKRGADPSAKSSGGDSIGISTSSAGGSSWSLKKMWRQNVPSYLSKKPSGKMFIDLAVFTAAVVVIYNYGADMNSWIQEQVPSEASLREKMAEMQAKMAAAQQAQMEAMQGGGMM